MTLYKLTTSRLGDYYVVAVAKPMKTSTSKPVNP